MLKCSNADELSANDEHKLMIKNWSTEEWCTSISECEANLQGEKISHQIDDSTNVHLKCALIILLKNVWKPKLKSWAKRDIQTPKGLNHRTLSELLKYQKLCTHTKYIQKMNEERKPMNYIWHVTFLLSLFAKQHY